MKRPAEYLVRKRDGRHEYLRSTKLAHSIHCALREVGAAEDWLPMEIASTVVAGLRVRQAERVATSCITEVRETLSTDELATAVEHVLTATGFAQAAELYANTGAVQRRRQALLHGRMTGSSAAVDAGLARCAPGARQTGARRDMSAWARENRFSAN